MPGQPDNNPWITFDVTAMQVSEPSGLTPASIVPVNGPFEVSVTFDGVGPIWDWVEQSVVTFQINFYAEGLGANAGEYDLGTVNQDTINDGGPYTVSLNNISIPIAGLYQLACTVTSSSPVAGFIEGMTLQVID